jgi:hypothetical protein
MTFFFRWFELTCLLFLAEAGALDGSLAILLLLFIALLLLLYDEEAAVTELLLFMPALDV